MKKAICLVLCLLIVFSLSGCGALIMAGAILSEDMASKDEIFAFVRQNQDTLLTCIESKDFAVLKNKNIIKNIDTDDIDKGFANFDCGGAGLGSSTEYCGFYYSADDDMTQVWCAPADKTQLTKSGNGYLWEQWKHGKGDNTYYTENICGHFYYYKATY